MIERDIWLVVFNYKYGSDVVNIDYWYYIRNSWYDFSNKEYKNCYGGEIGNY